MKKVVGGRYQIESRLGKGGMGEVFRVLDLTTDAVVALKRLDREATERRAGRAELRFRREFHTLASLAHPRIVKVFDYGIENSRPYYTMELLKGQDLREVVRHEPLDETSTCRILRDVAAALTPLHARGLVHRDLTARNVRVDKHGRGTLFDFGVLVDAGTNREIAGTAPFVAPELLQGMPVDARVDLYALGVLGYRMITGKLPYPARDLTQLHEMLQTPLKRPSAYADISAPLDTLIMSLLSSDPLARPTSAGELIDRLTSIGGLPADPELEARGGYAPSAALVGRDVELAVLDEEIDRTLTEGIPGRFLIAAESGSGKTRLLEEMEIRSKLRGARCVRISCDFDEGRPYATIATLLDDAFRVVPEITFDACEPSAPLLGRIFPAVRDRFPHIDIEERAGEPIEDRMRVQAAVTEACARIAKATPFVLLVDDVQRCDEASAAVFATLAETGAKGLVLGLALREGEAPRAPAAVVAMRRIKTQVRLSGLDEAGVEALLHSLFGEAPNLARTARWMTQATAGLPMMCTELARQLVDEGHIRLRDGTWVFPSDLPDEVPSSVIEAAKLRVARLSENARVAGEVLAVHGGQMELERCVELIENLAIDASDGEARAFVCLAELQREGILIDAGDRFNFRHDSAREALIEGIETGRKAMLHAHVAETLLQEGPPSDPARQAQVGWHLLHGGELTRGGALLESAGRALFEAEALADCIAPLEAALDALEAQNKDYARRAEITYMLLSAGWISNREAGARHAHRSVSMWAVLSGMSVARAIRWLGPVAFLIGLFWASMKWMFRLFRGPTPIRALTNFAVGLNYACALCYATNDRAGLNRLLTHAEPFRYLDGATKASFLVVHAMDAILDGRLGDASANLSSAIEKVTSDWMNPTTPQERVLAESGIRSMRLLVDTNQFLLERATEDKTRMKELGMAYYQLIVKTSEVVRYRYSGEEDRAQDLERQMEPETLQLNAWTSELQVVLFAHPAYAMCHDVEGLKRSLDALERYVADGMDFRSRVNATRANILRERGELDASEALFRETYESLDPRDELMAQYITAGLCETLVEAHRYDDARAWAEVGIARGADASRHVVLPQLRLQRSLALALDGLGDRTRAERILARLIAYAEPLKCASICGQLHAAAAKIALAHQDMPLFELHHRKADDWLRPTRNPGLIAIVARLADAGRERRARSIHPSRRAPDPGSDVQTIVAASQPPTTGSLDDLETKMRASQRPKRKS